MNDSTASQEFKPKEPRRIRGLFQVWDNLSPERQQGLSRLYNAGTLILGRIAQSGLGYLAWLITARLFEAREVGIASGVVSAMMLCVQLALFGIGAAVIKIYPLHLDSPSKMINTALNLVALASLGTAAIFLVFARTYFSELNVVGAIPLYALLFIAINFFGAVLVLMDHVSIAIKRGDQVLIRNILHGVITIAGVAALPLLAGTTSSIAIVSAWAASGLLACIFGAIQLKKSIPEYRYRASVNTGTGKQLIAIGLPNYLLTLAERAPNWILPIIITELLSPVDNARWYAVWMMAWVIFIVPISIGQTLFAEISHHPENFRRPLRVSLRNSLIGGSAAAAVVIALAPYFLLLLGKGYAVAGTTPLRILAVAILPITIIQMYYSVCRGTQRLTEATITGVIAGILGVIAATYAGVNYGLTGMAIAWLVTQSAAAIWAGIRISIMVRTSNSTGKADE
ncbi:MAG TPA: oligosaccharide flippase family protein [Bellilinea sp.]|nr:oligosaccharide flippase family protein [Bellilinea sp.]